MDSKSMTEEDAISLLKTLKPSNSPQGLQDQKKRYCQQQLDEMLNFLERVGLRVEDLDGLNIIHVTGTKGKGSTCAFTEHILRGHGFRTGFFSSPHLVLFRERIRINGQPIGEELFTKHFWQIYGRLEETKDAHGGLMPPQFTFLTVLAFQVFLEQKVDLVVLEVGLGGGYDCTNIIRKPWVCGIVSLGIDHIKILGDTIEKIAWHKAGIFKPGVPAFTVKQPEGAMATLRDRAIEIGCPLWVCPNLEDYQVDGKPLTLGLAGKHQHVNASLALQLSHAWLLKRKSVTGESYTSTCVENGSLLKGNPFKISAIMLKGLAAVEWSGRAQTLKHGAVTYFLDGAHTMRSIQVCVDWFKEASAQHQSNASGRVVRVVMFYTSADRDAAVLMRPLVQCNFDFAVFCPTITETFNPSKADLESLDEEISYCVDVERCWRRYTDLGENRQLHTEDSLPPGPDKRKDTLVFPSILSALQWITQGRDPVVADPSIPVSPADPSIRAKAAFLRDAAEIQVLITGSLYLVGGVLKIFQLPPRKWNM
ncbi:folylpolyglutamate synthase, mitochondrial-like [Antennarius striatus]|uniref:folylpolyglutamate synthase, mitochondrial-like n=1 Tax=Antennarius striatus TaxID=241820 RepID=UPI0035AF5538